MTVSYQSGSGLRPAIASGSRMFSSAVSVGSRLNCWKMNPTSLAAQLRQSGVGSPVSFVVADVHIALA